MTDAIEPTRSQVVSRGHWVPTHTQREAVSLGLVTKQTYQRTTTWARTVVEHHAILGTPRSEYEPNATHTEQLVGPHIGAGDAKLEKRLAADVDPLLDRAQAANEEAKSLIAAAEQQPYPITTSESGIRYTGADAVAVVHQSDADIQADFERGLSLHNRSHPVLVQVGRWAPWAETVGFLAFVTNYVNVPLLRPWEDFLGWSFAMIVVVGVLLGQTWLIRHAGQSHNQAREASADNNRHAAEAGYRKRIGTSLHRPRPPCP